MGYKKHYTEGDFCRNLIESTKSRVEQVADIILPLAEKLVDKNVKLTDEKRDRIIQIITENIDSAKLALQRTPNYRLQRESQILESTLKKLRDMGVDYEVKPEPVQTKREIQVERVNCDEVRAIHTTNWYIEEIQRLEKFIKSIIEKRNILQQNNKSTVGCDRVIKDCTERLERYKAWVDVSNRKTKKQIMDTHSKTK